MKRTLLIIPILICTGEAIAASGNCKWGCSINTTKFDNEHTCWTGCTSVSTYDTQTTSTGYQKRTCVATGTCEQIITGKCAVV